MAVTRTGSVGEITWVSNNSSQSVTVPSDAEIMVVTASCVRDVTHYMCNGASEDGSVTTLTLNSVQFKLGKCNESTTEAPANYNLVVFYLVSPSTGSQTLAWDMVGTNNPTIGAVFHYAFYKGINTTTPIRSRGSGREVTDSIAETGTMDFVTGDMAVAEAFTPSFSGENITSWTNATEATETAYGSISAALAENSSATDDINISADSTHSGYCMIAAVVLRGAETGISWTEHKHTTLVFG